MFKYLIYCISLLILTLLLNISSCGKKVPVTNEVSLEAQVNVENSSMEQDSERELELLDQTEFQSSESINSSFKLPKNKEVTLLDKSFVKNQDSGVFPSLYDVNSIYIINTVPLDSTAFEYYKKYFNEFSLVGFSILYTGKHLKLNSIKHVAAKYGANTVIYKSFYNSKYDIYAVEIMYLNGDLMDSSLFINRNASEAIPVQETLNMLTKKDNSKINPNSLRNVLGIDSKSNVENKVSSNLEDPDININPTEVNINSQNNLLDIGKNNLPESQLNVDIQETVQVSDIQKLEQRINNVVGIWMDSHDKSIVSIQEINKKEMNKNSKDTFVESSVVKYYGAYILLKDEKSVEKYNKGRTINTNELFQWKDEDLKFQFNSSGKNGIYLNKNKMPEVAFISTYPVKGILMVTMSTGETRYYIPVGLDIDPTFIRKLYRNLPSYISPKDYKSKVAFHYGTGLYGWIVSGGIILIGLGLLSIF